MNPCMGCILNYQNTDHPICIPVPSENLKGCIISRDPTSDFINLISEYKREEGNLQFENAPPMWLFKRIRYFTELNHEEMKKLYDFLDIQCYWTHFHKCPTSKKDKKFPHFTYSNGEMCADRWFDYEFHKYNLKQKIVILLGRDLQTYFMLRNGGHQLLRNTHVILLPHPSMANCGKGWSWNKNKPPEDENKKQIEKEIKKLLFLIGD